MGVTLAQSMMALGVLWCYWITNLTVASSVAKIYHHADFIRMCYHPMKTKIPSFSQIGCAAACRSLGCVFFHFEDGICSMNIDNENNIVPVDNDDIYMRNSPNALRVLTSLSVVGNPVYGTSIWTSPRDLVPDLAVDGSEAPDSYYHSYPSKTNAWWVLDLKVCHLVAEVEVTPPTSHYGLFKDIEVRLSKHFNSSAFNDTSHDFSSWDMLGSYYTGPPSPNTVVKFSSDAGVIGRYISIKRAYEGSAPYLVILEVRVKVFLLDKSG